ncbi:MAG: dihydroneopterin aldolase [Robiginitomaculum sp.]|nr:MAG: dihydroneopterin aldolase [Robiginitomaculum sp.]
MSFTSHTTIFVKGLEVQASIGIHPHEYESTQLIIIDVELDLGALPPPEEDRLAETLDYSMVADKAAEFAQEAHVQLVETLANRIAQWALETDERVLACKVCIAKPHALINADTAGVEIVLKRHG